VSDFGKKINQVFRETYGSKYDIISKHCGTKNQIEHNDFGIKIMDITEPTSVRPKIETECFITIETDTEPVFEVITKPEEAGGL